MTLFVFSAVMQTGTAAIWILQVFALLLYSIPPYLFLWRKGSSDVNQENYGHMKKDPMRGFKIALTASIPTCLLTALLFAFKIFHVDFTLLPLRIWNAYFIPLYYLLVPNNDLSSLQTSYFVIIFFTNCYMPLLSLTAYLTGRKQISIAQWLIYKKKK